MFKNLKSEFGGSSLWMMLLIIGGYIPMIIMAMAKTEEEKAKSQSTAMQVMVLYFVIVMFFAFLTYFKKYQKATKSLLIRCNIINSPNTDELDVNLLVELFVDLDINVDIDITKYDDFITYKSRILEKIQTIAAKKSQFLSAKLNLDKEIKKSKKDNEDNEDKKDNEDFDKEIHQYTTTELSNWLIEEFGKSEELENKKIFITWVKLLDPVIPESTPDLSYDKCIIISPRPFLKQFPFQTRDEVIDEYWITCKATRSEMIRWENINSDMPVLYSNYSPADNDEPIKVALKASTINTIQNRTMKHIISSQRMEYQNHYSLKDENEDKMREKNEIIAKLSGRIRKLESKPLSNKLKPAIIKKNNKLIVLLSLISCILFILLIVQNSKNNTGV